MHIREGREELQGTAAPCWVLGAGVHTISVLPPPQRPLTKDDPPDPSFLRPLSRRKCVGLSCHSEDSARAYSSHPTPPQGEPNLPRAGSLQYNKVLVRLLKKPSANSSTSVTTANDNQALQVSVCQAMG